MSNLGQPNIDLRKFFSETPVHEIDGEKVDSKALINSVSMVSMKLNSNNSDHVQYLTTEGLSKQQRLEFIRDIRNDLGSDLLNYQPATEFFMLGLVSTCNELSNSVLKIASLDDAPV